MKTLKKKYFFLVALSFLFVLCFAFGAATLKKNYTAKAFSIIAAELDRGNDFFMQGAAVRMDSVSGIRYRAIASTARVEEVKADENKSFGAFIFPIDWMKYFAMDYENYNGDYDYLNKIKTAYDGIGTVSEITYIEPVAVTVNGEIAYYELKATISNLRYSNMTRTYFGMIYIKDTSTNPATYTYANFDDMNKRSISYVASAALTKNLESYSSTAVSLYGIMQLALYNVAGVSESTAKANVEAGIYYDYDLELNKTNVSMSVGETFDLSSYLVYDSDSDGTYESRFKSNPFFVGYEITEGSDVVSLSGNRITAVSGGKATVTASFVKKVDGVITVVTKNLTVTVPTASAVEILSYAKHDNMEVEGFTANDKSINIKTKNDWPSQQEQVVVFKLNGGNGQNKFTFTIANNATTDTKNTLNAKVCIMSSGGIYDGELEIDSVSSNATISTGRNNSSNRAAALDAIAKGESLTATITLKTNVSSDNAYIKVMPQWGSVNYDKDNIITVSDIIIGDGATGEATYAVNIGTHENGTLTADCSKSLAGQKVYITAKGNNGYQLSTVSVVDSSSQSVAVSNNVFTMPESAVTISATFTKKTYTLDDGDISNVKFQVNDVDATTAQIGDTVTVVSTLDGATVTGFTYDSMARTNVVAGTSFTMEYDNVLLTAVSVTYLKTITVTGGVAKIGDDVITEADMGNTVTIVANTPATGYAFSSWTVNAGGVTLDDNAAATTTFKVGSANVSITANFALVDYTITNEDSENSKVQVDGADAATANYGDTLTVVSLKGEGWTVDGFTYTVNGGDPTDNDSDTLSMPEGNITITAVTQHKEVVYATISATKRWESDVPSATLSNDNKTVTITANRGSGDSGQHGHNACATISNSASNQQQITFSLKASANVTVYIALLSNVNDQYAYNNGNLVALESCTIDGTDATKISNKQAYKIPLTANTPVSITITTSSTFSSSPTVGFWPFMESGFNGTIVAENFLISAAVTKYSVTVNGGTASPAKEAEGETVTITANAPETGYEFTGWTVNAGGITLDDAATTTFTMGTADVEVTANYAKINYSVTNNASTNATLKVNGEAAATANYGDTITLTSLVDGKIVTAFKYTVDGGEEQTNNSSSMSMPAGDLVITEVTLGDEEAVSYATLHSVGKYGNGNAPDSITADTSTSATLHPNMGYGGHGQEAHWQYVEINGANGKSIITFTLNADQAKTLGVWVVKNLGEYVAYNDDNAKNGLYDITSVVVEGNSATRYSENRPIYEFAVTQNTDITITITLSAALTTDTVVVGVWPYAGSGYSDGSIVVKNFSLS